jgi:protein-S-isoprenylcysteine O-methyltransferase Ste14
VNVAFTTLVVESPTRTRQSASMGGLIYVFHAVFWSSFFVRVLRRRTGVKVHAAPTTPSTAASKAQSSPRAGLVFFLHGFAFALMYTGIGQEVYGRPTSQFFSLPWSIGALVIVAGAAIFAWALWVFDSWRCLAKLDAGHKLCKDGPYAHLRHPIYLACDLLAIGSFLWMPTKLLAIATIVMIVTGDMRARAEEGVLRTTFGDEYRRYERAVKRYIPAVY